MTDAEPTMAEILARIRELAAAQEAEIAAALLELAAGATRH